MFIQYIYILGTSIQIFCILKGKYSLVTWTIYKVTQNNHSVGDSDCYIRVIHIPALK